ncbi:hypothetical protein HDU80_006177 [Chytriomyces hyalinus]|nr:hypothetical protein HDU80_006177 [Chytriomyces hyalinus]
MSQETVPRENSSSSNGGGASSRDRERDGGLVGSAYSAPLFLSLSSRERERDTRSGAGSGALTGTGNNVGSVAYSSHAHAASSASYCDDDRSDAATIGTSVADWDGPLGHNQSSNSMQAGGGAADDHRFDAVKRWALRVNNSATLTDHAADNGVSDLLDDLVLVDPTLVSSPALSAANIQTPHLPLPLPLPVPVSSTSRISRPLPVPNISALASSPVPSAARLSNARPSSNVDPNFLDEFIASLEKSDAEAVCNFIASYRGPDVVSAMYAHLAKIEDLRAAERITEEMPAKPLEWESLPLESNDDDDDDDVSRVAVPQDGVNRGIGSVAAMGSSGNHVGGTFAFTNSTEDGLFSDEADVWDQTEGGQSTAESDWIVLDDQLASGGIQPSSTTLEHLPKSALTKILIYSHNSNLLKASRRLARLPIPTLGQELAEVILSLIPNASLRHGHSSAGSNASSSRNLSDESVKPSALGAEVSLHPTYAPSLNEILTRAARCPYANRSHLTLPCLARLSGSGTTAATPLLRRDSNASDAVTNGINRVTVETLGAVIDIAAKERRWNSVRGAIMLAKMRFAGVGENVIVSVEDIEEQSMRRPGVVFASLSGPLANNAPGVGSASAAAGSAAPSMEVNGSISMGQGATSEGLVPLAGSRVYAGLVANIVANHGKGLNVAFFKDLVEDGGVVFGVDVIRHCSEHCGISAAVAEYLLEENEKVTEREATTPQVHFGTSPGLLS